VKEKKEEEAVDDGSHKEAKVQRKYIQEAAENGGEMDDIVISSLTLLHVVISSLDMHNFLFVKDPLPFIYPPSYCHHHHQPKREREI
jgi:hypothetical protein